jgi:hypothetical protein
VIVVGLTAAKDGQKYPHGRRQVLHEAQQGPPRDLLARGDLKSTTNAALPLVAMYKSFGEVGRRVQGAGLSPQAAYPARAGDQAEQQRMLLNNVDYKADVFRKEAQVWERFRVTTGACLRRAAARSGHYVTLPRPVRGGQAEQVGGTT